MEAAEAMEEEIRMRTWLLCWEALDEEFEMSKPFGFRKPFVSVYNGKNVTRAFARMIEFMSRGTSFNKLGQLHRKEVQERFFRRKAMFGGDDSLSFENAFGHLVKPATILRIYYLIVSKKLLRWNLRVQQEHGEILKGDGNHKWSIWIRKLGPKVRTLFCDII